MPIAAISVASTMNAAKLNENSALSDVRASTSSQITASAGEPAEASAARRASGEITKSTESIEIEPPRPRPDRRSWLTTTLTSSRAMSQRMRSPGGLSDDPAIRTRLATAGESSSTRSTCGDSSAPEISRKCTIPASAASVIR